MSHPLDDVPHAELHMLDRRSSPVEDSLREIGAHVKPLLRSQFEGPDAPA